MREAAPGRDVMMRALVMRMLVMRALVMRIPAMRVPASSTTPIVMRSAHPRP